MVGERPEALRWAYLDANGDPIPIESDADVRVRLSRRGGPMWEVLGTIDDAAAGVVRYDWCGYELDRPGLLYLNFWTLSGGMLLASETIDVRCYASEAGPPSDLASHVIIDPGTGSDFAAAFYPIIRTAGDTMRPEPLTLAKGGVPWEVTSAVAEVSESPAVGSPLLLSMNVEIVDDVVSIGEGDALDFGPGTFYWDLKVTDAEGQLTILWGPFTLRPGGST